MARGNYSKPPLGAQIIQSHPLSRTLNGYWLLNDGLGRWADLSPFGNHLSNPNGASNVGSRYGTGAYFRRASSQYLTIPDNQYLSTGNIDFTIGALVWLDSKPVGDFSYIVTKSSGSQVEYNLYWDTAGLRFVFQIWNLAVTVNTLVNAPNFTPSLATWYTLIGWYDSTAKTVNLEVNNLKLATNQATGATTPGDTAAPFSIGRYNFTASRYFDGRIDWVGFWKRILTPEERTLLNFDPFCFIGQPHLPQRTYFFPLQLSTGFRGIMTGGLMGKRGVVTGGRLQ